MLSSPPRLLPILIIVPLQTPVPTPPLWLTRDQLTDAHAPLTLEWLFHPDSLTRRLTRLSADAFSVQPLTEGWQSLRADECSALRIPEGSQGWVREVYLRGHGDKWVFARSVAARNALENSGLHMDELGTRSLGELLFSDAAFQRGPLQICHYPALWLPAADTHEDLWARRSLFSRDALGILVAEVFLPNLWTEIRNAEPVTENR